MDLTAEQTLLANIRQRMPELEALLDRARSHWDYEDYVYRFYHHSFKVFTIQSMTTQIVKVLRDLLPDIPLNHDFLEIIEAGTGKTFDTEMNSRWTAATRPLVEAFFHARFMLEMAIKYGRELETPPQILPSGWAALLYLYNLR